MIDFKRAVGGMAQIPQWFVWKLTWNAAKGKYAKVPVNASGELTDAQDSGVWATFDAAVTQRNVQRMRNQQPDIKYTLGFCFTADCGYWFYDTDSCVIDGKLNEFALGEYAQLKDCFFEYSSSGNGLHFIGRNDDGAHEGAKKKRLPCGADIEFYTEKRGIAFGLTDEAWGCADNYAPREWMHRMLNTVLAREDKAKDSDHNGDGAHPDWNGYTDDNELIEAARKMKPKGGRMFDTAWFADLFDGNAEALCRVFPDERQLGYDESSADFALARLFVFHAGRDPERIERLMRMSALQRPKWDRHDYLARTIEKAIRATTVFYDKDYKRPSEAPAVPVRLYADVLADAQLLDGSSLSDIESLVLESASLNAIERDAVWKVIKKQTGTSLGVMRQIVKESEEKNDDHLVYAKSVIEHMGRDNVLSALSDVWHWDNSGVWRKCEERTVKSWSQGTLEGRTVVTKGLIDSVTDLFKTEVFQPNHRFDVGGDECVNTLNGEVSLINGVWTLQPHKREHYRTTQVPVVFDPLATAPRFAQFLREVFLGEDGEQQAQALLEMMGYSLMAHCKHEKFIICIGNGANGKSVVLKLLEDLCGIESVAGVQPSQFANTFQRAHLQNKLVNIVTELEQGAVIDDAALKGITSGETTTVEHKFGAPFQLTPFATCWFGANHMPHTRDFSDGLFRRAVILKFDAVFKPELGNCDPFLGAKLKAELSGILTMALNAYSAALVNGFTTPASSAQAKNEWRLEADQVAQFIDAACVASRGDMVPVDDLFRAYRAWAHDSGITKTLGKTGFGNRLIRLGFGRDRGSNVRYFTGVKFAGGVAPFPVLVSTRG